jgi:putative transposase
MMPDQYSEEQTTKIPKEAEAGIMISDLYRKYRFSNTTYYNWEAKYDGMGVIEIMRLKQLEDENGQLKQIVADLILDNQTLSRCMAGQLKTNTFARSLFWQLL